MNEGSGHSSARSSAFGLPRRFSRWWLPISNRAGYFTVGLVAFYLVVEFRAHVGLLGIRGPDAYWTLHWIRDYSDGFVRRGFLGEALRILGVDTTDYLLVTVLAWSISLVLALLLIEAAFRLSRGLSAIEANLLLLSLTISPATTGLLAETTGDPLQLLLAAYILVHWLVFVARPIGPWRAAAIFGLFSLIAGLIHEASIFLIIPGVAVSAFVLVRTAAARAAAGAYLLGSAIAVGIVILVSHQGGNASAGGYIHVGAATMALPDNWFPSFSELLAIENAQNFGRGIIGYASFAKRLIGSLLVPLYLACLIGAISFSAENHSVVDRRRVWATFAIPILLSAPLYLIAHDWGRFAGYAMLESLILLSLWRRTDQAAKPNTDRVAILGMTLVAAGLLLPVQSLEAYRISGLAVDYLLIGAGLLFVVTIAVTYRRFWRTQLGL